MFSLDTKLDIEDEIKAILARYIAKHGRPPQIVEVSPEHKDVKLPVPVLSFQYVQPKLVYLGEENDEKIPAKISNSI